MEGERKIAKGEGVSWREGGRRRGEGVEERKERKETQRFLNTIGECGEVTLGLGIDCSQTFYYGFQNLFTNIEISFESRVRMVVNWTGFVGIDVGLETILAKCTTVCRFIIFMGLTRELHGIFRHFLAYVA